MFFLLKILCTHIYLFSFASCSLMFMVIWGFNCLVIQIGISCHEEEFSHFQNHKIRYCFNRCVWFVCHFSLQYQWKDLGWMWRKSAQCKLYPAKMIHKYNSVMQQLNNVLLTIRLLFTWIKERFVASSSVSWMWNIPEHHQSIWSIWEATAHCTLAVWLFLVVYAWKELYQVLKADNYDIWILHFPISYM